MAFDSIARLQIVAEGVETRAQRERLLAICPDILVQGWLYGRSLPVQEFEAWVTQRQRARPDLPSSPQGSKTSP
jgi:sensor c-di-GMP phosphodiesterase-like protein